jgi:hypothetical protein
VVVLCDGDDLDWASGSRGITTNSNGDGLGDSLRGGAVVGDGDNGGLSRVSRLVRGWLRMSWHVRSLSGIDWLVRGWLGRSRHLVSLSGTVGIDR